jgi:hypothetical protein
MSLAGATAVAVNAAVARGVGRPWPPIVAGMILIGAISRLTATPFGLAVTVLAAHAMALAASLAVAMRGYVASPAQPSRLPGRHLRRGGTPPSARSDSSVGATRSVR